MWRRRGCTGTSTPASRATVAATGPAALITSGVETVPSVVPTPVTRSPARSIVVTRTASPRRGRRALAEQQVAPDAPGEVVGDRAADHATTDDHGAGGAGKGHQAAHVTPGAILRPCSTPSPSRS